MAVTAVTITSGPTVVGRSVTLSGTLSRDGGGTNNNLNFLSYTVGYASLGTITRLSDNSTVYNAAGTAGTDIAWTWTGTLPEGDYLTVTVNLSDPPYTTLATSASNVGLIQLSKPLSNIWIPRRDSRGLFVPAPRLASQPRVGEVGTPLRHYNYAVAGSNGIYTSVHDRVIRKTQETYGTTIGLRPVNTPYGPGIDAQPGWQFGAYPVQGGGWSVSRQTWVSLFYIYDASKYITNYPRFFGNVGNNPSLRNQTISWINTAGEQALVVSPDTGFGGVEVPVSGVGNGLHCMVVTSIQGGGSAGVRIFLDGQLVATTTASNGWNGGTFPTTDFFANSVSQLGSNIGNILFNALIYNYVASDSEAQKLSTDPYRLFFRDAPKTSSKTRLFSGVLSLPDPPTEFSSIKGGRTVPQRWRKQPQGKVDIDWNHPIAQGLNRSIVITGAGAQNPARPKQLVRYTTRANAFQYSTEGVGLDGSSSEGHSIYLDPESSMVLNTTRATYFVYGYTKNRFVYNSTASPMLITHGNQTIGRTGFGNGSSLSFTLTTNNFEYPGATVSEIVSNYSKFSAAMTFTQGGIQYFYHQGKQIALNSTTATTGVLRYDENFPLPFKVGSYNGLDTQMGLFWTRALSDNELAALHENPWQIFKPNPGRVYFLPSTVTPFKGGGLGKFLPQRWKQQPQGAVQIDWNHPITRELFFAYLPGNPRNLAAVRGQGPILSNAGHTNLYAGPAGRLSNFERYFDGTGNSTAYNNGAFTAGFPGQVFGPETGNIYLFANIGYDFWGVLEYTAAGNSCYVESIITQSNYATVTVSQVGIDPIPVLGKNRFISYTFKSGDNSRVFFGTNQVAASATTWDGTVIPGFSLNGFDVTGSGSPSGGFATGGFIWRRVLSADELGRMDENPWQIYKPNPGRIYFIPGTTRRGKFLFLFN